MDYKEIVTLVVWSIALLYFTITTICAVAKKIRKRKSAGEVIDIKTVYTDIADSVIDGIKQSEELFRSIARDGAKTGALKKNNVITIAERACKVAGAPFDLTYWSDFIDKVVSVMNVNKSNTLENTQKSINVQFLGGDKYESCTGL